MPIGVSPQAVSLLIQSAHRPATLWTIERVDGVTFRFTDHDTILTFEDQEFTPLHAVMASSRQKQSMLKARNVEVKGVINADVITNDDLRAGRYRKATIIERVVDWRYPWNIITYQRYLIETVSFTGEEWAAQIVGLTGWLRHKIGDVYGRTCRRDLGDIWCKVNLADYTKSLAVEGDPSIQRLKFHLSGPAEIAGWWTYGRIQWTSGANAGLFSQVKEYDEVANVVTLQLKTPYDIEDKDDFDITAGCDRTKAACKDKFNNLLNNGAFLYIPGADQLVKTPNHH